PLRKQIPTIPPDVEQVVLKALEKDPHRRFADVQAFAAALERALQTASSHPEAFPAEGPLSNEPLLSDAERVALLPSPPPSTTNVVTPPGQSLPLPVTAVSSSRGLIPPGDYQPSRGSISRRNFIVGLGLAGIAMAGGIIW